MSHYPYEEDEHTTLGLMDPPGPPDYPAPPGMMPGGYPSEGDRPWVHLVWEAFLFFVVLGMVVVVRTTESSAFSGPGLDNFLVRVATIGFIATGLAFSLRAAVPNLAVGPIAAGAGVVVASVVTETDYGYPAAIGAAVLAAAAVGLVAGVVVVVFHVPAWAATLGVAVTILGAMASMTRTIALPSDSDVPDVASRSPLLVGLFALISIAGGLAWWAPRIRRGFSGMRHEGDPGIRPGKSGASGALLALVVSSALAGGGGAVAVLFLRSTQPPGGDMNTYIALAAVLIGGVSAFGRRAGVFGTVLGVVLITLVNLWLEVTDRRPWVFLTVVGGAIILGLIVNRSLETAGRRRYNNYY